jgi:hypothetical protein
MLVLSVALIAGLAAGYALGGDVHNIDRLDLRLPWLVLSAIVVQIVIFSPVGDGLGDHVVVAAHLASYAMLLTFVAVNLRRPGIALTGAGILLNAAAIAANGGYMPTTPWALETAGLATEGAVHNNSALADANAHLLVLGDVFAVPSWIPVANVFSVGDVLIAAGVALLLATAMVVPARRDVPA